MRIELTPGYILHRRNYRDTSCLLDIWTRDYGRLTVVAKGMRGSQRRFQAAQAFQPLLFSWTGRGEMGTLTAAEPHSPGMRLTGLFSISGFYLNELISFLVHQHDPNPPLFLDYASAVQALAALSQRDENEVNFIEEQIILRVFEKRLLDALGYGINFEISQDTGEPISARAWYEYVVDGGFKVAGPMSNSTFLGENLLSYAQESFEKMDVLKDAKRLMRLTIDHHLGGKTLKSRELRIAMMREKAK